MKHLVKPGVYDRLYREEQYSKYSCLIELIGEIRGDVLDVGCGTGLLYEYLESADSKPNRYVCLDPSIGMLRIAKSRLSSVSTAILVQAYAEDAPFRDGVFSAVLSISTWGVLENPVRALAEIKRVLIDGGSAVVTGHPKTYTTPPSSIDPSFRYVKTCIDDFYIYSTERSGDAKATVPEQLLEYSPV